MKNKLFVLGALAACLSLSACDPNQFLLEKSTEKVPIETAEGVVEYEMPAYRANPQIRQGIEAARQINGIANPTPFAPAVNLFLAGLSGAMGLYAGWQQRKARQAVLDSLNLADGIEALSGKKDWDELKPALQQIFREMGVERDVQTFLTKQKLSTR